MNDPLGLYDSVWRRLTVPRRTQKIKFKFFEQKNANFDPKKSKFCKRFHPFDPPNSNVNQTTQKRLKKTKTHSI